MMRVLQILSATLLALPLWSCADLDVKPLTQGTKLSPGDITYPLPRTAINVTGTLTLTSCTVATGVTGSYPKLAISITATATPSVEPDPDNQYYLPYAQTQNWFKAVAYSVTYSSAGTLAGFNSTITDEAGPDVAAAAVLAAQVAAITATAGAGTPAALGLSALASERLNVRPGFFPLEHPGRAAAAPDFCDPVKASLSKAASQQKIINDGSETSATKIQQAQNALAKIQKSGSLVRSFSYKWIPARTELADKPDQFGYRILSHNIDIRPIVAEWLSPSGRQWLNTQSLDKITDLQENQAAPILLRLSVAPVSIGAPLPDSSDDGPSRKKPSGLVLLLPATATFKVCRGVGPDCLSNRPVIAGMTDLTNVPLQATNRLTELTDDVQPGVIVQVAQLGRTIIMPEHNGLFVTSTISATMNADGTIASIGYNTSNTAATGITTAATAAGDVLGGISARNTAIGAVNTATTNQIQAADTYNKAKADCITQQATIIAAGLTAVPCQ
jgi:hypothetical protein